MKKEWVTIGKMSHKYRNKKTHILIFGPLIISAIIFFVYRETYRSASIPSDQNIMGSLTETINGNNSSPVATTTVNDTAPFTTAPKREQVPASNSFVPVFQSVPSSGHAVGIAAGGGLTSLSDTALNQYLDEIVALGATWVRIDIEWGNVQYKSANKSDWSEYDNVINAIVKHHLNVLGIIAYTPVWARVAGCTGGAHCPPRDPKQFATFAAQVVAHYKNKGLHYWEIWNEPNNFDFWATKADCDAYTDLLRVTYPAIKAVDSNAVVITGGLAPESTDGVNISPTDFLNCIYRDGGRDYLDAVGHHPYTFPQFPSNSGSHAWAQMSRTSTSLRSIMIANGDGNKKIWMTEFGTPTGGPDPKWYVSEARQAQMMTDTFQLYKTYDWAGPIFLYTLKDTGNSISTNENFFGLLRYDGSHKPAYDTLKGIISSGI